MSNWKTRVHVTEQTVKVWVRTEHDEELMRARLPMEPRNEQALATLLHGLALWAGPPLSVAVSAPGHLDALLVSDLLGAALRPVGERVIRLSFPRPPERRPPDIDGEPVTSTASSSRRTR